MSSYTKISFIHSFFTLMTPYSDPKGHDRQPVRRDTEPRNWQARKATDAQQQQKKKTKKKPNKTDTRQKEEVAVKGEGATEPSRQSMIENIRPHASVKLNQSAM
jgi:hypothetical protein